MSNLLFVFGVLIICRVLAPDTFIEDIGVVILILFVAFGAAFEFLRIRDKNK